MILSIFLSVMLLLIISFCVIPRRMHLFEILFLWMVVWLLTHTISSIIIVNLQLLEITKELSYFWLRVFKRIFLYLLLIIWFLDISLLIKNKIKKYLFLLFLIFILISIEYCFILSGVFIKTNWSIGYSFIEWAFTVGVSYFLWQWYRRKLFNEGVVQ